jgi:hypothetical protein
MLIYAYSKASGVFIHTPTFASLLMKGQSLGSHSILTVEVPSVEEIAKAIWRRQHDKLGSDAIHCDVEWLDKTLPSKYWEEFIQDAQAILRLLNSKEIKRSGRTSSEKFF